MRVLIQKDLFNEKPKVINVKILKHERSVQLQDMRNAWIETISGAGGVCPCCDRWGKIDARAITETQALTLMWMYEHAGENWTDMTVAPHWILRGKTYTTLKHWGLIEQQDNLTDPTKKHSGIWRVTSAGIEFVFGKEVPKKAFIYNDQIVGFSEERTTIKGCFGRHFNYEEIMKEEFNWASIQ